MTYWWPDLHIYLFKTNRILFHKGVLHGCKTLFYLRLSGFIHSNRLLSQSRFQYQELRVKIKEAYPATVNIITDKIEIIINS